MFTLYIRNADGSITEVETPDLETLEAARAHRAALAQQIQLPQGAHLYVRFPKAGSSYYHA